MDEMRDTLRTIGEAVLQVAAGVFVVAFLVAGAALLIGIGPIGWVILFCILAGGNPTDRDPPTQPIQEPPSYYNLPDTFPADWQKN